MVHRLKRHARSLVSWYRLPRAAKMALRRDLQGLPADDPGIERTLASAMSWLCRAQDNAVPADGGVARDYSLIKGWSSSYPETTGYIIPTFLAYAQRTGDNDYRIRARRMLDWLVAIQLPCGGFQGGRIDSKPVVPVVFNTGQILLGLASGEQEFGAYRDSLRRAADWLVAIQDADGCWRQHASPFAREGDKVYDTHVAWGMLEAARVEPGRGYDAAALKNVRWSLTNQHENGWLENCCLSDPEAPLTHTLGYALRGVIEGWRFSRDMALLAAARRTADGLMSAQRTDGSLPGKLRSDWRADGQWACLTGIVQIASCWLMLHHDTGDQRYLAAALLANKFVRRTVLFDVVPDMAGGVKGSFPIDGEYCTYEYPNWAAKFLIDALLLEAAL
jgi:Squalene-hopene cyclase C-terminal domain